MTTTARIAILALLATTAAVGARGCGGVQPTQATRAEAREKATKAVCDRYTKCAYIGPGLAYENRESCEIAWRSTFESMWPAIDCEGRIDNDGLDVCLNRIGSTACMGVDFLGTLGICGKENVCIGAAPDGGGDAGDGG
jgi:hypothetical protein